MPITAAAVGLAPTRAMADTAMAAEFERSSLQFHERTSEGRAIGCELTFRTAGVDNQYRNPAGPVIIYGSLFFYPEIGIGQGFKVCGTDLGDKNEQFTVSYAYPIVGNQPYAKVEHGSRASGKCHIAVYTPKNRLLAGLHFDFLRMKIAYVRPGEQDVVVDLDFSESYADVADAEAAYSGCVLRLLETMK